jgi:hypothetical protein
MTGTAFAQYTHEATVDQTSDDAVFLDQVATGSFYSTADIEQTSGANTVRGLTGGNSVSGFKILNSVASELYVFQNGGSILKGEQVGTGGGHLINIDQLNGADAEIYQQNPNFGSQGNTVTGVSGPGTSDQSTLRVDQRGNSHVLYFEQSAQGSFMMVNQSGVDAETQIRQQQ